jgi:hypothetical protein
MTNFENLSAAEQAAINQSRNETGKPLLGFVKSVQASAGVLQAVAEDLGLPPGSERRFEISIKALQSPAPHPPPTLPQQPSPLQQPRWTEPQPPSNFVPDQEPSDFARSVAAITVTKLGRRGRPKVATEPEDPEPKTFAERLVRAIKRRRPQWRRPSD